MIEPSPFPNAPVALALRQLLPRDDETLLLRAALSSDQGAAAWSTWRARYDLPTTLASDRVGLKGLLPLLAYGLERNGAVVTPEDLSLLRMARYREQLRMERYHTILGQALDALQAGGVQNILLKGAALAHSVYPDATLRHNHDVDLLVQPNDLAHAVEQLLAQGFRYEVTQMPLAVRLAAGDVPLHHGSGLPVVLHTRLFRNPFYGTSLDTAWTSARPVGQKMPGIMLAPEWELVHIVGAMLCAPTRARVTWVCDAVYLLAANPAMDWVRVGEIAGQSRLAIIAYALFDYLRQQHQCAIPPVVFAELSTHFAAAQYADIEQLLQGARAQGAAPYGDLLAAAHDWQTRILLFRWMLFPPLPAATNAQATGWQLPLLYLHFNVRRATHLLRRRIVAAKPATGQVSSGGL